MVNTPPANKRIQKVPDPKQNAIINFANSMIAHGKMTKKDLITLKLILEKEASAPRKKTVPTSPRLRNNSGPARKLF